MLFVPYALRKQDEYAATARKAFEAWGFTFSSIHTAENPYLAASKAQVGERTYCRRVSSLRQFSLVEETHSSCWTIFTRRMCWISFAGNETPEGPVITNWKVII